MNDSERFAPPFSFELSMGEDVYWVPLSNIGNGEKSIQELRALLWLPPEKMKTSSLSARDIVQLLYYGNFTEENDCILRVQDGIVWEYHKPGYYAVKSNKGCCSTAASFFTYLYKQCDKIGYITIVRESGYGHTIVFVEQDSYIYYIDPLLYIRKYRHELVKETGQRRDASQTHYITGFCLRSHSFDSFVKYYNRYMRYSGYSHILFKCSGDSVPPIAIRRRDDICEVMYSKGTAELLYMDGSKFSYIQVATPTQEVDWSNGYSARDWAL